MSRAAQSPESKPDNQREPPASDRAAGPGATPVDNRSAAVVHRQLAATIDNSPRLTAQRVGLRRLFGEASAPTDQARAAGVSTPRQASVGFGTAPVQRVLMDVDAFKQSTTAYRKFVPWDAERPRKAIDAVDQALARAKRKLDEVGNGEEVEQAVTDLISAIDTYLNSKTQSDSTNARIDPTIKLREQAVDTLYSLTANPAAVDWSAHDLKVERTTNLDQLKALVAHRFNLPSKEIGALEAGQSTAGGANVQQANDWTVAGLKRAYQVMKDLPVTHTEANAKFASLRRYKGMGGWYRERENKIAIGTPEDSQLDAAFPDQEEYGQKVGKKAVDWTIRHEIGHAVYEKFPAAQNHTAGGHGGTWNVDQVAVLRELFAESNSEMANVLAAVPQDIAGQILQLADNVFRTDDLDTFGPLIVSRYNAQPQGQQAPITIEDIRPDPAWAFMQRDLEQTWRNGAAQRLGARAFVKSSDRGLNSYDPAALGRKVSNYQFRSASEWFAEAYAAHFDPTEERGALLVAAGDRPTRNLIATL